MNRMAMAVGVWGFAFSSFAADTAVIWSASEQPETLADGKLVLTYEEGKVKTIVASPAVGDRIVVSGDEMALASGATITMENATVDCGALVFKNVLNGTDKLTCAAADSSPSITFDTTTNDECLDQVPNWKLLFAGKTLDLYEPTAMSNAGKKGMANPNKHVVTNIVRETGALTFQAKNEWTSGDRRTMGLKVVKVKLRQGENGIEGAIENCYAVSGLAGTEVDTDIAVLMANPTKYPGAREYNVFTPSHQSGYGILNLTVTRREMPVVQFENHVLMGTSTTENLPVEVGVGVDVRGVGSKAFGANKYTGSRVIDGQLSIVDTTLTLKSPLSGSGTFKVARETADEYPYRTGLTSSDVKYEGNKDNLYLSTNTRQIATYRFLNELTNMTYSLSGRGVDPEKGSRYVKGASFYHYDIAHSGMMATCQVQCVTYDEKIACAFLEFKQSSYSKIEMRTVRAGITDGAKGLGVDFRSLRDSEVDWTNIVNRAAKYGIAVYNPTSYWSTASRKLVNLDAGESSYEFSPGARIAVKGCSDGNQVLVLAKTNSLPRNGSLEVRAGGDVWLRGDSGGSQGDGYVDGTCLMRVYAGGNLWHFYGADGAFSANQQVELWGGQLHLGMPSQDTIKDTTTSCNCYLCLLTLADGACVDGLAVGIGNINADSCWKVCGHKPSSCEAGLNVTGGRNNGYRTFDWEIWKTTDADVPDFLMNGKLSRYYSDDTHSNVVMRKYGAGKIRLNQPQVQERTLTSRTELYAGTWEFGVSGTSYSDSPYLFAGGTMEAADGVANDVGPISVAEASKIKVASTASLSFADSSGETWSLSLEEHLVIDADLTRDAVRFGTNANGLTLAQQCRLRKPDGRTRVRLDENGWARDYTPGLSFIIK